MPKPSDDVQDLKRRLTLLARLDGRALACAEGLVVVVVSEAMRVRDARPLARACESGPPPIAALTASIDLASPPTLLDRGLLAAARRDLRALASPRVRALVREAPRTFRRYGELDDAWIAHKEAALARLSDQLRAVHEGGADVPWLTRALDAIRLAYGDDAAAAVVQALDVLGKGRRSRSRAERFFALWALAFDPRPRDGGPIALSPEQVERGIAASEAPVARFSGLRITLDEALALHELDLRGDAAKVAKLVEARLPIASVQHLASLGRVAELSQFTDADVAAAYASFLGTLLPHYRSLGLDVPLTPEVFEGLRKTTRKREDLAVLAVCLMKHHASTSPPLAGQAIAQLDATLGLFHRRPAEAASILAELSGTTPGAGREAFPELGAWLGDDALLDRFVHLSRLAGVPVTLSNALRADLERAERLEGERAHLAALPSRTGEQEERLRRLTAGEAAAADPSKTRRRLADRIAELQAAAYEKRIDDVFRRILKDVWGISLPGLTPAWRDAIRFYLAVDKNQELLGTVLRAAAAGTSLARSLPRNRAWIDEVSEKLDVEAWLAPRAREVTLGEQVYRLAAEDDPVEVLRMGIPFDTCLSLEGGINAASTVVNAADANKRVLYLRDPGGTIVARKLVAVSEQGTLVGYHLYVAQQEHKDTVAAAFQTFCRELGAAARLPLAFDGAPRQLHPGFWYDDGALAFDEEPEEDGDAPVKAYCRSLGLAAPARAPADLRRRARIFGALRRGALDEVLATLPLDQQVSGVGDRAASWVVAQLSGERLAREADRSFSLRVAWIRRAADEGAAPLLEVTAKLAGCWRSMEAAVQELHRFPRTAETAAELVGAALASRGRGPYMNGHGLEHQVIFSLPWFARAVPVAPALALCDRVAPLFRWVGEIEPNCRSCVEGGEIRLLDAIEAAYASAPDPRAVIRCLGSSRSSLLAAQAALRIAARYALADGVDGVPLPSLPPPCLQPIHPSPEALRALARLRARTPALEADPDMLAAVLRQAASAAPRGVKLPVPEKAPFEALGDLLLQLDLTQVVEPWSSSREALSSWKPGPWELHHHRRHETARRAAIGAEARHVTPAQPGWCDALARLGDTAALEALLAEQPRRGRGGPHRVILRALQRAREVAAQVSAAEAADPMEAAAALGRGGLEKAAVDPGLVVAALARIERCLGDPAEEEPARALHLAHLASLPWNVGQLIAERLVARGPLGVAALGFVRQHLRERTPHFTFDVVPELARAFAGIPELERDLGAALAKVDETATGAAVRAAAAASGGLATAPGFFEVWMGEVLDGRGTRALACLDEEDLFLRAVQGVLAARPSPRILSLYCDLDTPEQRAVFLRELAEHPLRTTPEMRDAFAAIKGWRDDADNAVEAGWLAACLDAPARGGSPDVHAVDSACPRR